MREVACIFEASNSILRHIVSVEHAKLHGRRSGRSMRGRRHRLHSREKARTKAKAKVKAEAKAEVEVTPRAKRM